MIKQSTHYRHAVKAFRRELGLLLFQSRTGKKLTLDRVSKETGFEVKALDRMESGKLHIIHMWCILKLLRYYGKKLSLSVEDYVPPRRE